MGQLSGKRPVSRQCMFRFGVLIKAESYVYLTIICKTFDPRDEEDE